MAFPDLTDLVATTLAWRGKKIADSVTGMNAFLARLEQKGRTRPVSGGRLIYEPFAFAQNGNGGWYSAYDNLSVAASDVISGAEFNLKQYAVPVVISGLEELQNDGEEAIIDLLDSRMDVAESTMRNDIAIGLYSDGTGSGGKQIVGLDLAVPADPTTGTYGGINRATASNTFWRPQVLTSQTSTTTIQAKMNQLWATCVRGVDSPDLIIAGSTEWAQYMASLQLLQRFAGTDDAKLGFPSVKYMNADVVLDTVSGVTATNMYFINSKFMSFRPHKRRNMVALDPKRRYATNQDAAVQILAWAGALTCSAGKFHGRLTGA